MPAAESRALLAQRLSGHRLAADVDSTSELAMLCAGLPLALTVVAARAAFFPHRPLADMAAELRDAGHRLRALDSGDPATSVRSVLSWSYTSLTTSAAGMFRLLGVHPGPDISVPAAASLAAVTARQAHAAIAELQRAHLLTEHAPGRYAFHDLLRAYALERARADDPEPARQAAIHRVLDHYVHTACTAALRLNPARAPITLIPRQPGVTPERLVSHEHARAWFGAEHQVLMSAASLAAATGHDTHTWQLAWSLTEFLDRLGYWHEWAALWRAGVDAAQRLPDPSAHARAAQSLARAYIRLCRYQEARTYLRQALDLYATVTDPIGQAQAYLNLSWLCDRQGRPAEALRHAREALDLYRAAGDRHGEADCLNAIGWCHAQLRHPRPALTACQRAAALLHQLGDSLGEAMAWDSLGYAHHLLGQHDDALTCYQHALRLRKRIGDRYNMAATLIRVGDTHDGAGHEARARESWQQALAILEDLRHPDAQQVHAKLMHVAGGKPASRTDRARACRQPCAHVSANRNGVDI
jgi:tetratricopeptide (TPR) repeat protein